MFAFRPHVCGSEALRLGLLTALLLTLACGPRFHRTLAAPQDNAKATASAMLTFTELQPGWNLLRPGGETGCAKGGEYAFSVRPAARDKLLVFFQGGGACAVAERCAQGQPWYNPEIDLAAAKTPRLEGIFDFANPDNPFSAYSAVVVRYCTGDVHLGNRDVTYTIADDKGQSRRFEIRHRGYANASAVLRWIQANFTAPQNIFVSGVSAGSVATPFYASVLARQYPKARVVGLGDAQGHDPQINQQINDVQRMRLETARRLPGWKKIPTLGTRDRYVTAVRSAPQLQLFQFNHAYDAVSRTYFGPDVLAALRNGELDMLTMLRANQRDISRDVPTFRYFNVGGREHGALTNDRFYWYATDGHRFRDWVAAIEAGDPVASVDCSDCTRPEFRFSEQDLRIVERSLELISKPGAWISDDPSERCRPNLERFPLRCALYMAINEVTTRPPTIEYPGAREVIYTAIARMGPEFQKLDEAQRGSESLLPLSLYNNRRGTTAADVISLLEEVRDRIRAQLRPKAD